MLFSWRSYFGGICTVTLMWKYCCKEWPSLYRWQSSLFPCSHAIWRSMLTWQHICKVHAPVKVYTQYKGGLMAWRCMFYVVYESYYGQSCFLRCNMLCYSVIWRLRVNCQGYVVIYICSGIIMNGARTVFWNNRSWPFRWYSRRSLMWIENKYWRTYSC
jgi:hypothetical protein